MTSDSALGEMGLLPTTNHCPEGEAPVLETGSELLEAPSPDIRLFVKDSETHDLILHVDSPDGNSEKIVFDMPQVEFVEEDDDGDDPNESGFVALYEKSSFEGTTPRKRGRPRKNTNPSTSVKRARGRPRKQILEPQQDLGEEETKQLQSSGNDEKENSPKRGRGRPRKSDSNPKPKPAPITPVSVKREQTTTVPDECTVELCGEHLTGREPTCDTCRRQFFIKMELKYEKDSQRRDKFCCKICGMRYRKWEKMEKHLQMHSYRPFSCPQCGVNLFTKHRLVVHRSVIHERKTRRVKKVRVRLERVQRQLTLKRPSIVESSDSESDTHVRYKRKSALLSTKKKKNKLKVRFNLEGLMSNRLTL